VLVVDAVLIVDKPLPVVRLTRTLAPNVPFSMAAAGVDGAMITIRSGGRNLQYEQVPAESGRYRVGGGPWPPVLPGTRYDLTVMTIEGEEMSASTTTPQPFPISEWALLTDDGQTLLRTLQTFAEQGESVFYHPDNLLNYADGLLDARFTGADAEAYGAAGFQVSLFSLDREAGFVIDPPFLDEEDLADLPRSGSSPALSGEEGYLRLPWFSIYYDGRHLYKVFAVDGNWFDLVRSIPEGGGGIGFGGNLGDGVDPPIWHINGGIGLFGSAAVDSLGFFIAPLVQDP